MQRIPIVENVFCHTHKQFHLSHVTVADPDSSDSSRLYPNELKEVFTSIIIIIITIAGATAHLARRPINKLLAYLLVLKL